MSGKRPISGWTYGFSFVLLIILALLAAIYYFYVQEQKEQLSRNLIRQLTASSVNIGETLDGIRMNVEKAILFEECEEPECKPINIVKDKLNLIPHLNVNENNIKVEKPNDSYELCSSFTILNDETNTNILNIGVSYGTKKNPCSDQKTDNNDGESDLFTASVKLSELLLPSLPKDIFEYFEGGILIARNDTGEVLVTAGSSLQLLKLPEIALSAQNGEKDASADDMDRSRQNRSYNFESVQILDIPINLQKYKMILRPFHISENIKLHKVKTRIDEDEDGDKEYKLLLVGLIPQSTFRARTMAISPTIALVIICGFFIGLLALPYLHIRFIGFREELKARDVVVAFAAVMIGCSLTSLAVLHVITYKVERNIQEGRLLTIAQGVRDRFNEEMEKLENELVLWAENVKSKGYSEDRNTGDSRYESISRILENREFQYPIFEMFIGMDVNGKQIRKWSIRDTTTSQLEVPDREYFKQAKACDFNYYPDNGSNDELTPKGFINGRYIESIRSKTTGEAFAMLSLRHLGKSENYTDGNSQGTAGTGTLVTVIEAKPLSLIDTVLPPGYGFAVFDNNGIVQFHSQSSRNLRENFYEELQSDLEVRAIADAGVSRHIKMEYRFFPYNAYETPFTGTPWTLIVFVKQQQLGHMNLEVLTFTLVVYGAHLILFILICIILHCTGSRKHKAGEARRLWFWPDKEKLVRYNYLIYCMAVFIGIWILGDCFSHIFIVVWCCIYPLILIGIMGWVLRDKGKKIVPHQSSRTMKRPLQLFQSIEGLLASRLIFNQPKRAFTVMAFVYIVAGSVLPPITFYSAIHKEEVEVFTKYHQLSLTQSLKNRFDNLLARYADVHLNQCNQDKLKEILHLQPLSYGKPDFLDNAYDVYPLQCTTKKINAETIRESHKGFEDGKANESRQKLIQFLRTYAPIPGYDRISSLSRQLAGPGYEGISDEKKDNSRNQYLQPTFFQPFRSMRMILYGYRSNRYPGKLVQYPSESPDVARYSSAISSGNPEHLDLMIDSPLEYHACKSLILFLFLDHPYYFFWLFLCSILGLLILWWMIVTLLRVVFLTDMLYPLSIEGKTLILPPDGENNGDSEKDSYSVSMIPRQLHIRLHLDEKETDRLKQNPTGSPSDFLYYGIREIRAADSVDGLITQARLSARNTIILDQFDRGLDEEDTSLKKLELLEGLAALEGKRIVIKTSIDPLYFLTSQANDYMLEKTEKKIPIARWADALQNFAKLRSGAVENDYKRLRDEFKTYFCDTSAEDQRIQSHQQSFQGLDPEIQQSLVDEGWPNGLLKDYVKKLLDHGVPPYFKTSDIVDQIRDMANAHYRKIWMTCSTDEKVLLFRLAQEGFVNWRMKDSLRSLIRRRLVVPGPNYRLMNESFRLFVLGAETPSVFRKWQEAAGESMWSRMRLPIAIIATIVVLFFFFTQGEMFSQSLKIIAALTAGIPTLIKLIGSVIPNRGVTPPLT